MKDLSDVIEWIEVGNKTKLSLLMSFSLISKIKGVFNRLVLTFDDFCKVSTNASQKLHGGLVVACCNTSL